MPRGGLPAMHKVDPLARQVGKSSEVLGRHEPLRLEAPHLTPAKPRSSAPLCRRQSSALAARYRLPAVYPFRFKSAACCRSALIEPITFGVRRRTTANVPPLVEMRHLTL